MKSCAIVKVAVVIPCYNAAQWIERTIRSVQAQGDVVDQVVVVDDGSTDDSLSILNRFADDGQITLISGSNKGGCHARNRGLREVSAPFVMFLDADDEIVGPILKNAVEGAVATAADIVFSQMEIRYPNGDIEHKGPFGPPRESEREIFESWFDGDWVGTASVVWRTDFIRAMGGWDETLRVGQDGDVVMRALLSGARAARNEEGYGIYYRDNPGSVSLSGGVTEAKLAGQIALIERTAAAAREKGWGDNLDRVYAALYFLARKAFLEGYTDLGRQGLAILEQSGHRKHHGTAAHVLMSSVIGLERKLRWFGTRQKNRSAERMLD